MSAPPAGIDPIVATFWERWHRIVADKDVDALRDILAPDVTMGPPPYWDRLQGRELVAHLLGIIINTIDDFTYHREWVDEHDLALEFQGHAGDIHLQGIDLICVNGDGLVTSLDVLMRPLNAIEALREVVAPQMVAYLTAQTEKSQ